MEGVVVGKRVLMPASAVVGEHLEPPPPSNEESADAATDRRARAPFPLSSLVSRIYFFAPERWFIAAKHGDNGTLRQMISSSPDKKIVNARGSWGMTALHYATLGGSEDAVKLLIDEGADVTLRDCGLELDTALHHAAYIGEVPIVRQLLLAGAQPNLRNDNHKTPLTLALQAGGGPPEQKRECAELLRNWRRSVTGVPVHVALGSAVNEAEVASTSDIHYFATTYTI